MGEEIDMLARYPRTTRDINARAQKKSEESRTIARQFGFDYFDGSRDYGYGGFNYNEKYWKFVVQDMISRYDLHGGSTVLDVGCAKGFFLHDMKNAIPQIAVSGIDISNYAIEHSMPSVKNFLQVADARLLPYPDNSFDFVISINTLHNLDREGCAKGLTEIERVSRGNTFITVDAFANPEEKIRMESWNLTALTMMSTEEWKLFFKEVGYSGDYYWFTP